LLSKLLDDAIFCPIDMSQLNLPALYFKKQVIKQVGLVGVDPLLYNLFLVLSVGIRAFKVPSEGFRVYYMILLLLYDANILGTYNLLLQCL
jgi:hypothetical protein